MAPEMVARMASNLQAPNFVAPVNDAEVGWNLFFHGHPVERCQNATQRKAYYAAWKRGAEIVTEERNTADMYGPSIEDDYEWIRRGC